jgi:GT2 family glycosyltransferase
VSLPTVTAVVLAFRDEPWLERSSRRCWPPPTCTLTSSCRQRVHRRRGRAAPRPAPGVTVVTPAQNLGFAGGCNAGAAEGPRRAPALVNADAVGRADALRRLADVAGAARCRHRLRQHPVGGRPVPDQLRGQPPSSAGLSWAGGLGEPAAQHAVEREVASASGAGLVLRRSLWDALGGFAPQYFAYVEDTELSWRCWQRGLRVVYVPDAVVVHRYEFSRNPASSTCSSETGCCSC